MGSMFHVQIEFDRPVRGRRRGGVEAILHAIDYDAPPVDDGGSVDAMWRSPIAGARDIAVVLAAAGFSCRVRISDAPEQELAGEPWVAAERSRRRAPVLDVDAHLANHLRSLRARGRRSGIPSRVLVRLPPTASLGWSSRGKRRRSRART